MQVRILTSESIMQKIHAEKMRLLVLLYEMADVTSDEWKGGKVILVLQSINTRLPGQLMDLLSSEKVCKIFQIESAHE